jgi:hypothetical protein
MVAARGVPHSAIFAVKRDAGTRWHIKNRGSGPAADAADGSVPEDDLLEHVV